MKSDDTESWLDLAVNSRKENVAKLQVIEAELRTKFGDYDELIEHYDIEPDESELADHKVLLVHYYEKAPTALNRLLVSRRNDHGLLVCPFCGNPSAPDTLDHFMPKDDWPEFSINPNNLVPQCRGCAPTKSSKYFCDNSETAIFLHPMYSDLLSKIKFNIDVIFDEVNDKVSFHLRLTKTTTINEMSTEKVRKHLRSLKLNERIQVYCRREFGKWKKRLAERSFAIEDALNQRISERPETERSKDWKTALYKGILDNQELITHLNNISANVENTAVDEQEIEFEL
jgi:hypothetical protein